jgi:hypothetical protein
MALSKRDIYALKYAQRELPYFLAESGWDDK